MFAITRTLRHVPTRQPTYVKNHIRYFISEYKKLTTNPTRILEGQSILTSSQFDRKSCEKLMDIAKVIKAEVQEKGVLDLLKDKVSANLFFEPSTRTTGSFHVAMMRLGGCVLPVYSQTSSAQKGETLEDTIRSVEKYVDVIILRHPDIGSAPRAAEVASIPIINGGDGANEHPTQALLDLYCMKSELGTIDGLNIAMIGDLKYGRTVHSLSTLLSNFNVSLDFVSPPSLELPEKITKILHEKGIPFKQTNDLNEILPRANVMYVTRVQKERFAIIDEYEAVKDVYIITKDIMKHARKDCILMHPLPRVNETSVEVDSDPRAVYFKQVQYGMYMRMTLLAGILGRV